MAVIQWNTEAEGVALTLPADLDFAAAPALADALRQALALSERVTVDGAAVGRPGTACLQALVAASRQADAGGAGFAVLRPSPALREACDDLGLGGWLDRWSER
ncbi:MAG TPA: STAS domain-containing protein [Alphaproteobacteria bacterium]|nr:STAS domain-containing protein [Alphaproteobacteria bacterium]